MRPHRQQPTRLPHPWDSPGKNTGVGCHFLLQCRKVKSESEVAQSCPTLSNPMDCSLPGFSIYGIFQARVLEWGAIVLFLTLSSSLKRQTLPFFSLGWWWNNAKTKKPKKKLGKGLVKTIICFKEQLSLRKDGIQVASTVTNVWFVENKIWKKLRPNMLESEHECTLFSINIL